MARDDSALYSGLTPPSRRKALEVKKQEDKPDPKAEAVLTEIAREIAKVENIREYVLPVGVPDEAVIEQLKFARLKYDYLKKLDTRMRHILGVREQGPTNG